MSRIHLCNTFFELELAAAKPKPLGSWMRAHPVIELLQYLPLLYAEPGDLVAVTSLPSNPDPRLQLMENIHQGELDLWGPSSAIQSWATGKQLNFHSPPIDLIRQIQSKDFAFEHSGGFLNGMICSNKAQVAEWMEKTAGAKVIKTTLDSAGRGLIHTEKSPQLNREFAEGRNVICEPWVDRVFDFSSQWNIGTRIELLGLTVFETSSKGMYQATIAGPEEKIFQEKKWAIDPHLQEAYHLLKKVQQRGFFGNIGLDAFIYRQNGNERLRPIVELNARKTMSWVALQIYKKKNQMIRMSFEKRPGGLLPGKGEKNIFIS